MKVKETMTTNVRIANPDQTIREWPKLTRECCLSVRMIGWSA
jgi:hypothetical protein